MRSIRVEANKLPGIMIDLRSVIMDTARHANTLQILNDWLYEHEIGTLQPSGNLGAWMIYGRNGLNHEQYPTYEQALIRVLELIDEKMKDTTGAASSS